MNTAGSGTRLFSKFRVVAVAQILLVACGSGGQGAPASAGAAANAGSGGMTGPAPTPGTGGTTSSGANPGGSAAGMSVTAGSSGVGTAGTPSGGAAGGSCSENVAGTTFESQCLACAKSDCDRCLCSSCGDQLTTCASTAGCQEILTCIRDKGCTGIDCYCGTFDALACSGGQSDGPCKSVFLAAPGGHEPSLANPSAGPASDAALAVGNCAQPGQPCNQACSM